LGAVRVAAPVWAVLENAEAANTHSWLREVKWSDGKVSHLPHNDLVSRLVLGPVAF
jgi:hypothetical protein